MNSLRFSSNRATEVIAACVAKSSDSLRDDSPTLSRRTAASVYLSRRGSVPFAPGKVLDSRCPLLGRSPRTIQVESQTIGHWFLRVETQPEVGEEAYDEGAKMLTTFFHDQIKKFLDGDLDARAQEIIRACLDNASASDYDALSTM